MAKIKRKLKSSKSRMRVRRHRRKIRSTASLRKKVNRLERTTKPEVKWKLTENDLIYSGAS